MSYTSINRAESRHLTFCRNGSDADVQPLCEANDAPHAADRIGPASLKICGVLDAASLRRLLGLVE